MNFLILTREDLHLIMFNINILLFELFSIYLAVYSTLK